MLATQPVASPAAKRSGLALLPFLFAVAIGAFALLPRVHDNPRLLASVLGASGTLIVWQVILWLTVARRRPLLVTPNAPVKQHYIQAMVQMCLYAYWGWHWQQDGMRPIYHEAPLIVLQWFFLYAFDGLFAWSRGRAWWLASGPTPIVLSTNLFIWFRDDWFFLQFPMLIAGLLGKEFLRWQKEGQRRHIFNPSGFGLACAATALIVTGQTDLTWAKELATTIDVPHGFLFLFGLGLVVQGFFRVTLMTFAAAVTMVLLNEAYASLTSTWLFGSTNLPAAAFLGLMLLMTDPSTSPRSNLGRVLFGAGYGLGYVLVFELLGHLGAPELFAKLFPVPVLNCCVRWLDRLAQRGLGGRLEARWQALASAARMNLVHMAAWASVFLALLWNGYFDGEHHPGNSVLFWKRAVQEGRFDAERKLVVVAGNRAISGDAAAINELGITSLTGQVDDADPATRHKSAALWFARALQNGSPEAAHNVTMHFLYDGLRRSDEELGAALARLGELANGGDVRARQLLGLAHETGGGLAQDLRRAVELYRGCGDDPFAWRGLARINLTAQPSLDVTAGVDRLQAAAAKDDGEACHLLAYLYATGRGVSEDMVAARRWYERAQKLGHGPAAAPLPQKWLPPFTPPRRKQMARPAWSTAFPLGG